MKHLLLTAALALCTGAAFAQSDQAQTSVGQPTDTNEPVYQGCLTGTKNQYMLTTTDGNSYRLHSDKDIDDHLNHHVEVRGSVKTEGGDHSQISKEEHIQEIDVADLKSMGDESCTGPAAKSDTTAQASADTLPQSDVATTDVGAGTDKDQPLFKGCVSGTEDNYTLSAENGDKYRLHSDKDINEHVGDRVEIRGTLKPEGESKAVAGGTWKGELDVADIKTVEDGACK
jgi:hypothetical protein